jgi:hypothetical protein
MTCPTKGCRTRNLEPLRRASNSVGEWTCNAYDAACGSGDSGQSVQAAG